jgi:methyltransferase (TIGR00027 family)
VSDGLDFFELDQEATQRLKIESLAQAGIASDHVTFVTVDFSRDETFGKLRESGYDPSKKTLFLWEGVTPYLAEEDVRKTLRDIRDNAAAGSAIVTDLYGSRVVDYASRWSSRKTLEYTGEEWLFGLAFDGAFEEELRRFVESEGLTVAEAVFLGTNNPRGPLLALVELLV